MYFDIPKYTYINIFESKQTENNLFIADCVCVFFLWWMCVPLNIDSNVNGIECAHFTATITMFCVEAVAAVRTDVIVPMLYALAWLNVWCDFLSYEMKQQFRDERNEAMGYNGAML